MPINQLFKEKPPIELIEKLLNLLGLNNINDTRKFSKKDRTMDDIFHKRFMCIKEEFRNYYMPCKFYIYFNEKVLTYRRIITIVRQCLRLYNYTLQYREKYIDGSKVIEYNIDLLHDEKKKQIEQKKCTIVFD